MTETQPNQAHYLNVNSIRLVTKNGGSKKRKTLHDDSVSSTKSYDKCVSCVLRKLDEHIEQHVRNTVLMTASSTLRRSNSGIYTEFTGSFSEYFFMMYGEASYVSLMTSQQPITNAAVAEELNKQKMEMYDNLTRAYTVFTEMSHQGISESSLNGFVNSVASLVEKINRLKQVYNIHVPLGLVIDTTIPLPSTIYHNYIKE